MILRRCYFGRIDSLKASLSAVFATILLSFSPCYAGLIHQYPFTLDASDTVGGANGTLVNSASVSGGLLLLNGVDQFVQFSQHIVPTSGSYSVAIFAQQNSLQTDFAELISQGFSGGPGFYIGHDPSRMIRVTDSWVITGIPYPSDGLSHEVVVTVDSGAGVSRLYLDGSLAATLNSAIVTTAGGTDTRFGRQFDPFAEFFNGALDEVRIYDHALTAAEVAALSPVAEPATLLLFGTTAAGLGLARWRQRGRRQQP